MHWKIWTGGSQFKPKKYLQRTFSELRGILYKDKDLSNLKFWTIYCYTRSKKEYNIQSKIPVVVCICPECKNIELMLDSIQKACDQVNLPLKYHDLIIKVACYPITKLYAEGKCENCPGFDLEPLADCDSITYYKWQWGEKYYENELIEKQGIAIVTELKGKIKEIKMHHFRKRTQETRNEYKKQK